MPLITPFKLPPDLKRYPVRKNELLQAWDSADELILKHLGGIDLTGQKILVVGDSFGALSCALEGFDITTYSDSYVSTRAIQLNSQGRIHPVNRLESLAGDFDIVLIRIPKNMSFFEDILCSLSARLKPTSRIICGYMIKYQSKTSFELLERYIGKATTSLAAKKARLIFADFQRSPVKSPYPIQVRMNGFEIPFSQTSNLFSREKLDIGTRFLLENIPNDEMKTLLDLGCGNGIVGIAAKQLNPDAKITFCDESELALESARSNYKNYFSDSAEFIWTNSFEDGKPASFDWVICNPPFHQGGTIGDFIAWEMFTDSHRVLRPGGRFRVIGNTHLQYQHSLKRIFGNSEIVASNSKFTIVDAIKQPSRS